MSTITWNWWRSVVVGLLAYVLLLRQGVHWIGELALATRLALVFLGFLAVVVLASIRYDGHGRLLATLVLLGFSLFVYHVSVTDWLWTTAVYGPLIVLGMVQPALAYLVSDRLRMPRWVKPVLLCCLLLPGLLLVGHDLDTGVSYETSLEESVVLEPDDSKAVLELSRTNEFHAPRREPYPEFQICLVGGQFESPRDLRTWEIPDHDESELIGAKATEGPEHLWVKGKHEYMESLVTIDGRDEELPSEIEADVEWGAHCDVERDRPTIRVGAVERGGWQR